MDCEILICQAGEGVFSELVFKTTKFSSYRWVGGYLVRDLFPPISLVTSRYALSQSVGMRSAVRSDKSGLNTARERLGAVRTTLEEGWQHRRHKASHCMFLTFSMILKNHLENVILIWICQRPKLSGILNP